MDTPEFETRAQRRARKRLERKNGNSTSSPKMGKWLWFGLAVLVIALGSWWFASRPQLTSAEKAAKNKQRVHDLVMSCTTDMATTFHIHAHLTITINGQDRVVPADTGITTGCMHPLHTHDTSGILHIESPRKEDFTLGEFFDVWKEKFANTQILDTTVDSQHQMKLFINGKEVTTGKDTILHDHESIAIIAAPIGQTITPPANYTFPSNL